MTVDSSCSAHFAQLTFFFMIMHDQCLVSFSYFVIISFDCLETGLCVVQFGLSSYLLFKQIGHQLCGHPILDSTLQSCYHYQD